MSERILPAPYKGMAPYSEGDAPFFFGRENEPTNIIFNLMASRLTLLYGESGVGKSSLLRAGVVHNLHRRARRNVAESGSPEFAVAIFSEWRDDPVAGLTTSVRDAVNQALNGPAIEQQGTSKSLVDTLSAWTDLAGGPLYVILDQFEDYFLYHKDGKLHSGFASEFSRLVNCRDLRIRFLISIREDSIAKLDCFEEIPNIFENTLRLARLDRTATEAAIRKPIDRYNRFYAAGRKRLSIDDDLVAEVMKGPSVAKTGRGDTPKSDDTGTETVIETPFLQLVMTCLWKEEMRLGSTRLRLETLKSLGGVDRIVETHLSQAMKKLSRKELKMAVPVFHYLVTPSGHKIAYAVSDLAGQAHFDQRELTVLLEKLSGGENRILRPFGLPERPDERLYEISLDVLAKPILDWRTRAEEKAKFARLRRMLIAGLVVMSLLTAGGFSYARSERARRQAEEAMRREEEAKRHAVESSNVSSQVLAQLYKVILGSKDPEEARKNAESTLKKLNDVREDYKRDGSKAGEGIALNNIAGFHRFLGESYAAIEEYEQAGDYYRQAQGYYQQALETLKNALGADHTEVATSLTGLAVICTDQGKYADAEILFEQSLGILEKALKPNDRYLTDAIMNLADCYNNQGKYYAAESAYNRALDIRKSALNEDHPDLAISLYGMGWFYLERGMYAEAEPLFQKALAIWKRDPQDARSACMGLDALSALYREWGKHDEAERYRNEARTNCTGVFNRDHLLAADHFENAALLHDLQGKADSEGLYDLALGTYRRALGDDHPDAARARSNLAFFYFRHGRPDEAEMLFNQALQVLRLLPDSPDLAQTLCGLGQLFSDRGVYAQAEPLFIQALEIQTKAIPDHRRTLDTLRAYADLLRKTNRDGEASQMEERANQIRSKLEK